MTTTPFTTPTTRPSQSCTRDVRYRRAIKLLWAVLLKEESLLCTTGMVISTGGFLPSIIFLRII